MGWLYNTHPQSKDSFVKETLERNFPVGSRLCLLDHSVRGGRLWVLIQPDGHEPVIGLFLLERDSDGCWGRKDMDESMGPYYYDCPLRWLERAPEPPSCPVDGHAGSRRTWRDFVRDHHTQQAVNRKRIRPSVGSTIRLGDRFEASHVGRQYEVTQDLGRRGLMLNGYIRLKAHQIKWVETVSLVPAAAGGDQ
jgi:hypothetical protein